MRVKHLKTKTKIELEFSEVEKYITCVHELDNTISTLHECQDLFMSDLNKLETLRWRLTDLLGLEWNSDKHRYIKEEK